MTETEIKNLLQLLHSKDSQNALLAINILWGIEEIPKTLQLVLGFRHYLDSDERVRKEADELLKERLGIDGKVALIKSFLALFKAHRRRDSLFNQPLYSVMSSQDMLDEFDEQHNNFAPLVSLHPYYLSLYVKAGIYWTYEVKTHLTKTHLFFEDILQWIPNHPDSLFELAKKYEKEAKEPVKAIEAYQKFLKYHPNLSPTKQMMTDYSVTVYLDLPTSFNALQGIAHILQHQLQDYKQALTYYFKAKNLVSEHVGFSFKEAAELIWFWEEDVEQALNLVEEGLTLLAKGKDLSRAHLFGISPRTFMVKTANLHTLMGDILAEEKQQIDLALMHYKKTLEITGRAIPVRLKQIRLVFHHFKDYWQVERLCNEALKIDPKNFEVKRYLEKAKKGMRR